MILTSKGSLDHLMDEGDLLPKVNCKLATLKEVMDFIIFNYKNIHSMTLSQYCTMTLNYFIISH